MDIKIDKIDTVVARTKASYKDAKEALDKNEWDVLKAIIYLEELDNKSSKDTKELTEDIISKVKEVIKEGNATKIIVKRDDKVILNIPVTLATIGSILYLKFVLLGLGIAVIAKCTIEIVKENGDVVTINDMLPMSEDESFDKKKSGDAKDSDTSEYIDL